MISWQICWRPIRGFIPSLCVELIDVKLEELKSLISQIK